MSQVSQDSMVRQANKTLSMSTEALGKLGEPQVMLERKWEASSWEVEEVNSTANKSDMSEVEVVASLAVREGQYFLDKSTRWSSPGKVRAALEAMDLDVILDQEVGDMSTKVETLDEGTMSTKTNWETLEVNVKKTFTGKGVSGDSEDADGRDQKSNGVHRVFSLFKIYNDTRVTKMKVKKTSPWNGGGE